MGQGLNRGVEQGFTGDEQKCEAGKQRCTVINRDAAGVPWSCSKSRQQGLGCKSISKSLAERVPACITCTDRQEVLLGRSSH